ncbi:MAG: aspartate kinase [Tissierellia bacterium]|nr:aspartate kinase [Tissierellia bacterium]
MEDTVVLKFGGSSVKDHDHLRAVAKRIIEKKEMVKNVVVTVSAMGDTTDELIEKAKKIDNNPSKREMDQLLVTGEQITIALLAMMIQSLGHDAISLTGQQAGFVTYGHHGRQKIDNINPKRVIRGLKENKIVIVAGFQGINDIGDQTTLGRGGSDTSAVALAAKLNCPCEIYTDVDGIYTVDPRIFPDAKRNDYLSYEEVMEMASLGAGVIASRAVELAYRYKVPLYIGRSTGKSIGTRIEESRLEKNTITNISVLKNILLVDLKSDHLKNKSAHVFKELAGADVNIDVISLNSNTNNQNIYFTTTEESKNDIELLFKEEEIEANFQEGIVKVSVIGDAMRNQSGIAARAFGVLVDNHIDFYQVSTSEISISFLIDGKNEATAVRGLAREFNL